jgi:hypothetical protein
VGFFFYMDGAKAGKARSVKVEIVEASPVEGELRTSLGGSTGVAHADKEFHLVDRNT